MEATIPFARMGVDDNQPMLRLITTGLFLSLILFVPAGIEALRRGRRALRRQFAVWSFRQRQESLGGQRSKRNPSGRIRTCLICGVGTDASSCEWPFCLYLLQDYQGFSFEEKLRLALMHPVGENRKLAVELLGVEKGRLALKTFRELAAEERDPYVVVEIALATARIGGDEAGAILFGLKSHSSEMVREIADRLWRETSNQELQRRVEDGMTSPDEPKAV
jgi:hypothetical protein